MWICIYAEGSVNRSTHFSLLPWTKEDERGQSVRADRMTLRGGKKKLARGCVLLHSAKGR